MFRGVIDIRISKGKTRYYYLARKYYLLSHLQRYKKNYNFAQNFTNFKPLINLSVLTGHLKRCSR